MFYRNVFLFDRELVSMDIIGTARKSIKGKASRSFANYQSCANTGQRVATIGLLFHGSGRLTLPITSTVLNLALNQASSPNCPLRIRPRVKSFGKPHTAEMKDASRRLFTLVSAHAV